ncbi:hypothetical protein E1287_32020 [Actinomadura sp. KC06]|uniref:hypothetical protein n=1 Tax=Actinomadura sp. KC06 TaxID=2530369 RepID=UPI001045D7F4|nr:hypothetical protein [Actinomadura sp. KC06]TDD28841.1 hypothetical protein E1287_32020 [Actinomadura sp. KC06]
MVLGDVCGHLTVLASDPVGRVPERRRERALGLRNGHAVVRNAARGVSVFQAGRGQQVLHGGQVAQQDPNAVGMLLSVAAS